MNHSIRTVIVILVLMLVAAPTHAQDLLIRNATVHAGDGTEPRADTDILIRDGRVRTIGTDLDFEGEVIDAQGRAVTPGLFAGLSNLGLVEVSLESATADAGLALGEMRPEFDVLPAYNPFSSLIPVTRTEGFTHTVITPSRGGSIIAGQGHPIRLVKNYDPSIGPGILFISLGAEQVQFGQPNPNALGSRAGQYMLLRQAFAEAEGRNFNAAASHNLLTPMGRQTLSEYLDGERPVVFEVNRAADIVQVLRLADEFDLNAVIAGGAEAWRVADRLAEAGVAVLLNPLQNLPSSFDAIGSRLDNAALLHEAGVTIAFSGAGSHNARKTRQLAGNAVSYGLPAAEGLAAIASNPAQIFGYESGQIIRGAPADLVIWSGDPLEVTSLADQVFISGQPIDMRTRQTELMERYLGE